MARAVRTYALGIDFGGTKLLGAVVDLQSGKVIAEAKKRSSASDSPKAVLDRLNSVAEAAAVLPRQARGP